MASRSAGNSAGKRRQAYSARQKTRRVTCAAAKRAWASEVAVRRAWTLAKRLARTQKGGFLTQVGYSPRRVARRTFRRMAQEWGSGGGTLEAERGTGKEHCRQCERKFAPHLRWTMQARRTGPRSGRVANCGASCQWNTKDRRGNPRSKPRLAAAAARRCASILA